MDLQARGRRDLAFRLLDGWLTHTGDFEGLPALRFAVVYRALVRAMAQSLRGDLDAGRACLDTAFDWLDSSTRPSLAVTMGLPGSGKSTRALQWALAEGGVRLRSDVERKRLFGLDAFDSSRDAGLDIYDAAATALTYDRLIQRARAALSAGYPVVIDAANLRRHERERMLDLAAELGLPCSLIACEAPMEELRRRIVARSGDASEADVAVLERLARCVEPVGPAERARYASFEH